MYSNLATSLSLYTGRGEPIRLTLAGKDIDFDDLPIDFAAMKQDKDAFPCGQAPRYQDDTVDMVQSNAIMRYLARKYDLYGSDLKEHAQVDMIMDTVESMTAKYLNLIYQDQLSDDAKAAYWKTHCDAATVADRNGGAHFCYLDCMVKKLSGEGPFALGSKWTVADVLVFNIVDAHIRIWGDEVKTAFPLLAAHHEAVAAIPGIAAYISSDRRPQKQNGNALG